MICELFLFLNQHQVQACRKGGAGGQLPPQILEDQKALPGSGGAPHYYLPPQIFRLCNMPAVNQLSRADATIDVQKKVFSCFGLFV